MMQKLEFKMFFFFSNLCVSVRQIVSSRSPVST